jgi:hypothetical protein
MAPIFCAHSILYKPPPPQGGEYQPASFEGKNIKQGREKEEKCKSKRQKVER